MKHKKKLIALLCLAAVVCALSVIGNRNRVSVDFEKHKWMIPQLASAKEVRFYEGLPNPGWERELLQKEKRENETLKIAGWHFYATPLDVSEKHTEQLKKLLSVEESYSEWAGDKKCGEFHPDCMVELMVEDKTYYVQLCFSCSDAHIHGPSEAMKCSFDTENAARLVVMLKKYRKYRPFFKGDPLSDFLIPPSLLQEEG